MSSHLKNSNLHHKASKMNEKSSTLHFDNGEADEANAEAGPSEAPSSCKGKSKGKKPKQSGVVYLSSVPYHMTATRLREYLSVYGSIGRIYLAASTRKKPDGSKERHYSEGWVEFGDKRVAKRVALSLNATLVGGRKRSKAAEALWNMKYLSRFKWTHLQEQLDYERAVHSQRMRTEIAAARRSAGFFQRQIEKGKKLRQLEEKVLKKGGNWERYQRQVRQRDVKKPTEHGGDDVMQMIFAE